MQQIHVKRYSNPQAVGYEGSIEPEDRSWILFIPTGGAAPSLFVQAAPSQSTDGEGRTDHDLINVRDLPREQEITAGLISPVSP
jgi:hypothetical protein